MKERMKTRAQQVRERDRRVLTWSLIVAGILHAGAFVYWSGLRAAPPPGGGVGMVPDSSVQEPDTRLELHFGPPTIFGADGAPSREPPDRFLEVDRLVHLSGCAARVVDLAMPVRGSARLTVNGSGRVDDASLVRSTGDDCGDAAVRRVASALLYHWLPNDRYTAPVNLIQSVTIVEAHRRASQP